MGRPNVSGKERPHLKAWLRAERRTQEWLANEIGGVPQTHQTTVSLWIRGGEIPLGKAQRIAEITGLSLEDIAVIAPTAAESSATLIDPDEDDGPASTSAA